MLKKALTVAAVVLAFSLNAQVNTKTVASKNEAVFTSPQPTRIMVASATPAANKVSFTSPAMQHIAGNSAKQTPRTTEVFGVQPRRIYPTH